MKKMIRRTVYYNIILIIFCIIKYILYINFANKYNLTFEAITTMLMICIYVKIFTWKKSKVNYMLYIVYICFVIGIWTLISVKIDSIESHTLINDIILYNLKNVSTYTFIIIEPSIVISVKS